MKSCNKLVFWVVVSLMVFHIMCCHQWKRGIFLQLWVVGVVIDVNKSMFPLISIDFFAIVWVVDALISCIMLPLVKIMASTSSFCLIILYLWMTIEDDEDVSLVLGFQVLLRKFDKKRKPCVTKVLWVIELCFCFSLHFS